jgi:hypothetical protein
VVSISTLLQFLYEGDWLGFIQAVYASAFGSGEIFYAVLIMAFMAPLYIRTKSLLLVCILWILIGGGLITAMPLLSNLAMFLIVLGISGVLYKLFIHRGE